MLIWSHIQRNLLKHLHILILSYITGSPFNARWNGVLKIASPSVFCKSQDSLEQKIVLYHDTEKCKKKRHQDKMKNSTDKKKLSLLACLSSSHTRWYDMKPSLGEPETNVLNFWMTTNWIAVYGITNSSAGTFPRQNPCSKNPPQFFFCFHSLEDVPFCFFMQVHTLHLLISSGTMGEFHNPHP